MAACTSLLAQTVLSQRKRCGYALRSTSFDIDSRRIRSSTNGRAYK